MKDNILANQILKLLSENPTGLKYNEISKKFYGKDITIFTTLQELLDEGLITTTVRDKDGSSDVVYKVVK